MISRAYILGAQRARTRWPGAPRAGMEGGKLALAHFPATSSPRSQALPNSQGGFHNAVRKSTSWERKFWHIFRPWKILAVPPFSCQATSIITSLAPILEFQYIYDACEVLETTDKATTRTPEQSSRRTAKLSNVSCLENNLVLLGVVHYFKEWVSWLPPEGEERLRLPHKYPLRIYAYWKTSDDEVTIRCFSTWFDPSRTLTNRKGSTTQRYEHDDQIDETHLYFLSSGFIVIIISSSSLAFIIIYIRLIAYSIFPVYRNIRPTLKIYVLRPICTIALSCSQT